MFECPLFERITIISPCNRLLVASIMRTWNLRNLPAEPEKVVTLRSMLPALGAYECLKGVRSTLNLFPRTESNMSVENHLIISDACWFT